MDRPGGPLASFRCFVGHGRDVSRGAIRSSTAFLAYVAGGVALWKLVHWFFELPEKVLPRDTLDTIALWLLDAKPPDRLKRRPETFPEVFDAVFGKKLSSSLLQSLRSHALGPSQVAVERALAFEPVAIMLKPLGNAVVCPVCHT